MRRLAASCAALVLAACATGGVVTHGGQLALRCADPGAEVFVDGVSRGLAGDFDGKKGRLILAKGLHRLEVRGTGGATAVREIELGPQDDLALNLSLPAPAEKEL